MEYTVSFPSCFDEVPRCGGRDFVEYTVGFPSCFDSVLEGLHAH